MNFKPFIQIEDRIVGHGNPCFIVAEAGVSHFGSLDKAKALVDMAVTAGADAVKFQIFRTDRLISSVSMEWIKRMRPKELSISEFRDIRDYCDKKRIIFFATAHDPKSLDELAYLDPPAYKIGSGELQNLQYFRKVGSLGKPVIFSTGMFSENDIRETLEALSAEGCKEVVILHCVTSYPVPPKNVNLMAIRTLKDIFPGPVGYSDHCSTYDVAAASVLLGADLIEKHITLEKNIPNAQDWKVSCGPNEIKDFVKMVRRMEAARGDGLLVRSDLEMVSVAWARKSIVAARDISAGEKITMDMIDYKRPGTGISPRDTHTVLGCFAKNDIQKDVLINSSMLEK